MEALIMKLIKQTFYCQMPAYDYAMKMFIRNTYIVLYEKYSHSFSAGSLTLFLAWKVDGASVHVEAAEAVSASPIHGLLAK